MLACCGMPSSPWHPAQEAARSSTDCAKARADSMTSRIKRAAGSQAAGRTWESDVNLGGIDSVIIRHREACAARRSNLMPGLLRPRRLAMTAVQSVQGERDDGVAALVVELHVAAGGDHDVLLAADHVGGGRRIDAGPGIERPQHLAVLGVIGAEAAVAFAANTRPPAVARMPPIIGCGVCAC